MCGIFGLYDRNRKIDSIYFAEMMKIMGRTMGHRGPDGYGDFIARGIGLGNQRLAVIDILGGNQPFISDDGNIVVVQNGEIYNHIELASDLKKHGYPCRTNSDTEVILRLYESEGLGFLRKLNGMFAIAIYDLRKGEVYLIRDRLGVKPLYIQNTDYGFAFASEIKSLLAVDKNPVQVNYCAIDSYLAYNYVPPPLTMYEGIQHLPPGQYATLTSNGIYYKNWWNLNDTMPKDSLKDSDVVEEFRYLLSDAVRLRLRSDVPFGAFLSGGLDSSSVVAYMAKHLDGPVNTFCIGFDDPKFDESPYAAEVAALFQTNHYMQKVASDMLDGWSKALFYCDQPHGDISFLPTYAVSELAAKHVKVVLTGDGGDELFAGYDKYKYFFSGDENYSNSNSDFHMAYYDSICLIPDNLRNNIYSENFSKKINGYKSFDIANQKFSEARHYDHLTQALYLDTLLLLSGNNLVKPDRMGMAVSIEARNPFLDYRMVEFAFGIPGEMKLRNGETKYIYKQAMKSILGESLTHRKKQMFTVPVGDWFKKERFIFAKKSIDRIKSKRIFKNQYLDSLLQDHVTNTKNNTRELRALIALDLWFENQNISSEV